MGNKSSGSVQRVKEFLEKERLGFIVKILAPESTRTSILAAEAIGCSVAEIAKSIAFVKTHKFEPIIVILSGDKFVNIEKLAVSLGLESADLLRKMTADEVKLLTGYPIGGLPPFPHDERCLILVDKSICRFARVWAAAGSPNSVMQIPSDFLINDLGYRVVEVSE